MRYLLGCIFSLFALNLFAQNPTIEFSNGLSSFSSGGQGKVTINYCDDSQVMIARTREYKDKITGYRVRIFSGNSQNAGEVSRGIAAGFSRKYPNVSVYSSYVAPSFMVSVGNFATKADAVLMYGRLLSEYRGVLVIKEEIPITEFRNQQSLNYVEPVAEEISDQNQ